MSSNFLLAFDPGYGIWASTTSGATWASLDDFYYIHY